MKKVKAFFVFSFIAVILMTVPAAQCYSATPDEAVIVAHDDEFVPLHTLAADSSLKEHSSYMTNDESILFYTQTTMLALIAGYLIIFKVRCLPHGEKMHRRKK